MTVRFSVFFVPSPVNLGNIPGMKEKIEDLNRKYMTSSPEHVLEVFAEEYNGLIAFATSLGAEDQVIAHMISGNEKKVRIFTIDTGRLFQETYDLIQITNSKFGPGIQVYFPSAAGVEEMVNQKGINLFFESIENRKHCCHIRKTEPLKRALAGMKVWITGLRRDQSVTRSKRELVEWDETNGLLKLNPLVDWSTEQVWTFIKQHKIPYNPLHDLGYPSIGCQPCTRAIKNGEDIRAGRWWWELPQNKECGIHPEN